MLCTPLLCAGNVVGVINLQHRLTYQHSTNELRLLSMLGFLVGAEVERARLESENVELSGRLETRKAVDRAKSILQRDLSLSEDEAYRAMQTESRQRRKSVREIAEAVILGEDLRKSQSGIGGTTDPKGPTLGPAHEGTQFTSDSGMRHSKPKSASE